MSEAFRRSLDRLSGHNPDEVAELLESEEELIFDDESSNRSDPSGESEFVGAVPPSELLAEPVATIDDLRVAIARVDSRWKLDAILALEDYLS